MCNYRLVINVMVSGLGFAPTIVGARQMLRETFFLCIQRFSVFLYRRTFYDRSVPVELKKEKKITNLCIAGIVQRLV